MRNENKNNNNKMWKQNNEYSELNTVKASNFAPNGNYGPKQDL
jgi:hypothetical protein